LPHKTMAMTTLLVVVAVSSMVTGQDIGLNAMTAQQMAWEGLVPMAKKTADDNTLHVATPRVGGTKSLVAAAAAPKDASLRGSASNDRSDLVVQPAVAASQSYNKTSSDWSAHVEYVLFRFLQLAAFFTFVLCPVMLTPQGRNGLINVGIISADSEFTKLSLQASGELTYNIPLVQQAAEALGALFQGASVEEHGMEMHRTLINESDGDSEDEAELTVDLSSLSLPLNNVAETKDHVEKVPPNAWMGTHVETIDLLGLGPSPVQKNPPEFNIQPGEFDTSFVTDDFFDEDDDF